jgi:hypothetical protein
MDAGRRALCLHVALSGLRNKCHDYPGLAAWAIQIPGLWPWELCNHFFTGTLAWEFCNHFLGFRQHMPLRSEGPASV